MDSGRRDITGRWDFIARHFLCAQLNGTYTGQSYRTHLGVPMSRFKQLFA